MKKEHMGSGVGMGNHHTDAKRVFTWLWHSWLEAQRDIPLLRWVALAAFFAAGAALYLASAEGKTVLDIAVYGMITLLFVLAIPVILYLLFEVYRKHRSDAIFDSKRLADHIRKVARQEIEANEESKLALENTLMMMKPQTESRSKR